MAKASGTLQDIAEILQLSQGTVSRALSGRGDISQETRDKVAEVAAQINYQYRRKTSRIAGNLSRISVCMGNRCVDDHGRLDSTYVGLHMLSHLEQKASSEKISLLVGFVDAMDTSQSIDALPLLHASETQGIVLVYPFPEAVVTRLVARVPVVSIEHVYPSASLDVIGPTHAIDAASAVEYLHQLGHRRIAFVADESALGHKLTTGMRHAGFVSGLNRFHLQYRPRDVVNIADPMVSKKDLPRWIAARKDDGVTAVITAIDRHGYLLWEQLPAMGIHVPSDLSIVGIGGIWRAKGQSQLTTFRCDYEGMAATAIEALRSRRNGRSSDIYQEIRSIFVAGESTSPCK